MPKLLVNQWTQAEVDAECAGAYGAFARARTRAYEAYFTANSELADEQHPYKAKDFASALPLTAPLELARWLPPSERHPQHLSGNSSQMLALGLLGTAARRDRGLEWLWDALNEPDPLPGPQSQPPPFSFESKAAKAALGETGGPTTVDFFVEDEAAVICCECKWVERGFGCTCPNSGAGTCRQGIYDNASYWQAGRELFGLAKHEQGVGPCRLSYAYQAVRNAAATLALAGPNRRAVFALFYNADNPYFARHGEWPGWAQTLALTLEGAHPNLDFRAVSWQQLVKQLPLDAETRSWASEKHGLD